MTTTRSLEDALRALARERDTASDSRWDALAAGKATPDEIAELRGLAALSREACEAFAAFHPLDDERLDRLAEGVAQNLMSGSIIADKYELTRQIGRGAVATVWEAEELSTGRVVAVKLSLPERSDDLRERFQNEARALSRVVSPHVAKLYDSGITAEGEPFLVMERLRGETLADLLESKGRIESALVARIAREIATALSAVHAVGLVHCDLHPGNVFLQRSDANRAGEAVVKLIGFHGARHYDVDEKPADTAGISRALRDAAAYPSPELLAGLKDIDPRTDIWSLGAVLFRILTGVEPFSCADWEQNCWLLSPSWRPPSRALRAIPSSFDHLVAWCTEPDRNIRLPSASKLQWMLARFEEGLRTWPESKISAGNTTSQLQNEQVAKLDAESRTMSYLGAGLRDVVAWCKGARERPKVRRDVYKLLVVGSEGTGKSSFTLRWVSR